jgi:hypothetical protein
VWIETNLIDALYNDVYVMQPPPGPLRFQPCVGTARHRSSYTEKGYM